MNWVIQKQNLKNLKLQDMEENMEFGVENISNVRPSTASKSEYDNEERTFESMYGYKTLPLL